MTRTLRRLGRHARHDERAAAERETTTGTGRGTADDRGGGAGDTTEARYGSDTGSGTDRRTEAGSGDTTEARYGTEPGYDTATGRDADAGRETATEAGRGTDTGYGADTGRGAATERPAETGYGADTERGSDTGRRADTERGSDAERGSEGGAVAAGPGEEVERRAPDSPTDLPKRSWAAVLKGTLKEFKKDELTDRAAALTYYSILALFPALLALVSLLGIVGQSATQTVLDNIQKLAPGPAQDVLRSAVQQMQGKGGIGSVMAIVGLLLAVWSASGYVAAFIRSANAVYDIPEGRPVWKVLPVRVGVTVVLMVMAVISALIVVFTGGLARQAGTALGVGDAGLTVWSIAKWPVLVLLVTVMIALLYWATPNARVRGFRWITPGSFLALVIWMIASAGFALYVANFGSYNKTYGTLAGVIVFLVWLWITNLAILLGLEFDAELARQRAVAGGHPADDEPYVQPRDTRKWDEEDRRRLGS